MENATTGHSAYSYFQQPPYSCMPSSCRFGRYHSVPGAVTCWHSIASLRAIPRAALESVYDTRVCMHTYSPFCFESRRNSTHVARSMSPLGTRDHQRCRHAHATRTMRQLVANSALYASASRIRTQDSRPTTQQTLNGSRYRIRTRRLSTSGLCTKRSMGRSRPLRHHHEATNKTRCVLSCHNLH